MKPDTNSFTRYLMAKQSVDDRALNRVVVQRLRDELTHRHVGQSPRILEIGMGVGTMIQRLLDWRIVINGKYTGIDSENENIFHAVELIPAWAAHRGLGVTLDSNRMHLTGGDIDLHCDLRVVDLFDFLHQAAPSDLYDVIIANAFLDLVDVPRTLPGIAGLMAPGGLGYFSINFDGMTLFEPEIDPALDAHILNLYHRSMDERFIRGERSGDSRTGRRLFHWLQQSGMKVLACGASDWMVYPLDGKYTQDEAYFLHYILHFFEQSLHSHPELDALVFANWLDQRRTQIEHGELIYIAHQLDYLAEKAV